MGLTDAFHLRYDLLDDKPQERSERADNSQMQRQGNHLSKSNVIAMSKHVSVRQSSSATAAPLCDD